ncbi:MAG TPA: protein-L-isoaspartate(D-aspartate) O-methyltransferase [Candidatus Lambdaproteobacteria bacterium]|nr:protein-L-isoaspartate(D-aspartate) O-methyltransferase [Candidatus Lambdaproteobacteria bacterium]HIB40188.1 protein-L-isoaspartate(D-aspartate) O-methyltransferase [Candidatus Lambdaproteobacteria bacterium]
MKRLFVFSAFLSVLVLLSNSVQAVDWVSKRTQMIDMHLTPRGIWNPAVLKAMKQVPRHEFVPQHIRKLAYADRPLPIGEGQTISQPYVVAWMSQLLELEKGMKVLEIGTGSGYQAAVLATMGVKTYSMEIRPNLAREVKIRLKKLGYKVEVRQGDGYYGWNEHAPFDRVIITAAANHVPRPLLDQLKPGGKLILPLGNVRYSQNMTLIEKDSQGKMRTSQHGQVRFVPMVGAAQE